MKLLTVGIESCDKCYHAGMYYTDCEAMYYRNQCEHPDSDGVWIYGGTEIPENCPLPDQEEK